MYYLARTIEEYLNFEFYLFLWSIDSKKESCIKPHLHKMKTRVTKKICETALKAISREIFLTLRFWIVTDAKVHSQFNTGRWLFYFTYNILNLWFHLFSRKIFILFYHGGARAARINQLNKGPKTKSSLWSPYFEKSVCSRGLVSILNLGEQKKLPSRWRLIHIR